MNEQKSRFSPSTKAVVKALIDRSPHSTKLPAFLPTTMELESSPYPTHVDLKEALFSSHWIETIHYSWFLPFFQTLSLESQQLFLSLFTPYQIKGLEALLKWKAEPTKKGYPHFLQLFLMAQLKKWILPEAILPQAFLPQSELTPLLSIERADLILLIDFLGLHDLSIELKQIVDKELLSKIHSVLTHEQVQFLHYCSKQPLRWLPPKLSLTQWDGQRKSLMTLLHYRGLVRLGCGVLQEDPNFIWYLLHRLDTGRAQVLEKVIVQKNKMTLIPYFKNQILHILNRFQK